MRLRIRFMYHVNIVLGRSSYSSDASLELDSFHTVSVVETAGCNVHSSAERQRALAGSTSEPH